MMVMRLAANAQSRRSDNRGASLESGLIRQREP
jgi:hypothetical protein